jgi:hypothetical protein
MKNVLSKLGNPYLVVSHLCRYFPFRIISDKAYLKLFYRAYQGRSLKLDNPETFNEKIQWLKLYDRNPVYTTLSDKYRVREYVAKKIGEEYLIPLLGVWKSADEIDFDSLPNQFVLKCNHDSGSATVCRDKTKLNYVKTRKKLNKALKYQYYWKSREWNYKDIKRCVVAEEYITNQNDDELTDYKYFCFEGKPAYIQVDSGRFTNHIRNFYDVDWNYIDVEYGIKNNIDHLDPKPVLHPKMLELASILSEGFPHVRVDFYISKNQIFFGEMTLHHGGGVMVVNPRKYDIEWGKLLTLPAK